MAVTERVGKDLLHVSSDLRERGSERSSKFATNEREGSVEVVHT
jgi:hypothetical protein